MVFIFYNLITLIQHLINKDMMYLYQINYLFFRYIIAILVLQNTNDRSVLKRFILRKMKLVMNSQNGTGMKMATRDFINARL